MSGQELTANLILQKTKVDNLSQVKNLNLWGMDLQDISIVKSLPNLEVLALSVNHITSLADLIECKQLKELYLRKNDIANLSEVHHLTKLPLLTVLWLCDNPCAAHPLYRTFAIRCCPKLKQFDNIEVSPQERAEADRLQQTDINEIMTKGAHAQDRKAVKRELPPDPSLRPKNFENQPQEQPSAAPPPPQGRATPPTGSKATGQGSSSRSTQKNVLSAILTLMNELSSESLAFLNGEIKEELKRRGSH